MLQSTYGFKYIFEFFKKSLLIDFFMPQMVMLLCLNEKKPPDSKHGGFRQIKG